MEILHPNPHAVTAPVSITLEVNGWLQAVRIWPPDLWSSCPVSDRPTSVVDMDQPGWRAELVKLGPTDAQVKLWELAEASLGLFFDRQTGECSIIR